MEHLHCYKFEIQKKMSQCLVEILKKNYAFFPPYFLQFFLTFLLYIILIFWGICKHCQTINIFDNLAFNFIFLKVYNLCNWAKSIWFHSIVKKYVIVFFFTTPLHTRIFQSSQEMFSLNLYYLSYHMSLVSNQLI